MRDSRCNAAALEESARAATRGFRPWEHLFVQVGLFSRRVVELSFPFRTWHYAFGPVCQWRKTKEYKRTTVSYMRQLEPGTRAGKYSLVPSVVYSLLRDDRCERFFCDLWFSVLDKSRFSLEDGLFSSSGNGIV